MPAGLNALAAVEASEGTAAGAAAAERRGPIMAWTAASSALSSAPAGSWRQMLEHSLKKQGFTDDGDDLMDDLDDEDETESLN